MANALSPEALSAEVARLTDADELEKMVELVEVAAPTLADPALANRLRVRAALACIDGLGDSARAAKLAEEVVLEDPTNDEALHALRDAYGALGKFPELREVYQRQLDLSNDVDERKELLIKLAELEGPVMGNLEAAEQRWWRLLELDPNHARALASLEAIELGLGKWEMLATILQREIDLAPMPADAVALYSRLAELYRGQLGNRALAAQCYRNALDFCGAPALASKRPELEALIAQLEG